MVISFARTDTSLVGRWWWTVDRWTLLAVALLIAIGTLLTLAASPAVAEKLNLQSQHFVLRQMIFLPMAMAVMFVVSLMSPRGVRRISAAGLVISLLLVVATLFLGAEIKGATRWLQFAGLSLQPSEFVKPCFAVVAAWILAEQRQREGMAGALICCALFALVVWLLVSQPDFGMTAVVAAVWFGQCFIAGLSMLWVGLLAGLGLIGAILAYATIPHVASRIDRFLDPASGDSYQIDRALDAFGQGGLLGRGPGEGMVKRVLPDAHTDFIFSVAGEEFGLIACLIIVALFGFITLRGFARLLREEDLFVLLAAAGLLTQFGLQAIINIGVNVNLLPTKGMTLPFISYGGSSMLALALAMGMVLALTRRRPNLGGLP
ncbi:MAG: putative lipid II flippase FtsW [Rhodospirillaceae bacterium]|jgi:cell division protein FtsW|nr:putative lipid II flippase FtsW [Rhodospirillaceae bacterium]MBT4488828.1 putative lipid II flippase FtsW [Rhodospirillaceae bacterium]MBT5193034.1 putative lipid II flippase FtsW [Rhodospirillaceae bacterium]MBT5895562.1 putative lipid II flippase FtsW [Rhodospirillaceae bacterium]